MAPPSVRAPVRREGRQHQQKKAKTISIILSSCHRGFIMKGIGIINKSRQEDKSLNVE
jgi:hypothetical protein